MLCSKPYRQGVMEFGCGQCMPCRVKRSMLWTGRMLLEQRCHDESCFATLTFREEALPVSVHGPSVQVKDLQLFLKRLRYKVGPIRYFGIGEYGDESQRPHYHLALFKTRDAVAIQDSWGQGYTSVGDLNSATASYIAKYCTKRMTRADDPRLKGRSPEFAIMSRNPGIGAPAVESLAESLTTREGAMYVASNSDVVGRVHFDRNYHLGRYLRNRLRDQVGLDESARLNSYEQYAVTLQLEMSQPGARAAREGKRRQDMNRSRVLDSINRSKRGSSREAL